MTSKRPAFSIEKALDADIPAMVELLAGLFTLEADFTPDAAKQAAGLSTLIREKNALVLTARQENRVIGMVTVQGLISTAEGGEVGLLEDLVVKEGLRGRGIGTTLIQEAIRWSRDQGMTRIQLLADRSNTQALVFYHHTGWQATQLVALRHPIPMKET
ncbi:GNAT family acetyltransferase [Desulfobotulus alkaliphilus]|uniref:GNAT family acetyltransferase n=1 Tax=Desulfobotulus alkaliphilus TaxID=622671 RepID=A0A562RGC8_9BACT|nr:GNAT family N-acetyltransferase [Desulfobotulus alkaliphilus]TWI68132.1 GNAT family acetyltransferase [Desulfobotulus alkaliphilus]